MGRRARHMEEGLANPVLLESDKDAEYSEIIDIDLNEVKEPLLACPNDPDDIKPLSEIQGTHVDEVLPRPSLFCFLAPDKVTIPSVTRSCKKP